MTDTNDTNEMPRSTMKIVSDQYDLIKEDIRRSLENLRKAKRRFMDLKVEHTRPKYMMIRFNEMERLLIKNLDNAAEMRAKYGRMFRETE